MVELGEFQLWFFRSCPEKYDQIRLYFDIIMSHYWFSLFTHLIEIQEIINIDQSLKYFAVN